MTVVKAHAQNLNTIIEAAKAGNLALLEVQDRKTGKPRAALVAVNRLATGEYEFVPFALMIDGNPYEQLNPPLPEGGFATED